MLKMFVVQLITIIHIALCSYPTPIGCTPFGVRLFLGLNFISEAENETLSIWFNTRLECPKSYITVQRKSSIKKTYCDSRKVAYNNYSSYVHRCSIDYLEKGQTFSYMPFGWTGNASDSAQPYCKTNIKAHIIDDSQDISLLVLADWGYLQKKAKQYDRLDSAFDYLLKSANQPDLVCLGGDYGYDLSTNNGKNYENFLIMLSQISVSWPCIFITGNHEYYSKYDLMLFNTSFQLYNLLNNNITTLNLGKYSLLLFDPNQIFYHNASKINLMAKLQRQLQRAKKDKPIIAASHYPLACSAFYTYHCTETLYYIEEFFELMIDYNVVLYIGAHFHTYERLYPFFKGNQFKKIMPPYSVTNSTKYLVSIVEGIAGNDEIIVEFYLKILNFTAAVSYNKTGYGIMNVGDKLLTYQHYKAIDYANPVDEVLIIFDELITQQKQKQKEEEEEVYVTE